MSLLNDRLSINSVISTDTAQTDDTIMASVTSVKSIVESTFKPGDVSAVFKLLMSIEGASWDTAGIVIDAIVSKKTHCKMMTVIAPGGAYSITRKADDVFPIIARIVSSMEGFEDQKLIGRGTEKIKDSVNLTLFRLVSLAVTEAIITSESVPAPLKNLAAKALTKHKGQMMNGNDEVKKIAAETAARDGPMTIEVLKSAKKLVKVAFS